MGGVAGDQVELVVLVDEEGRPCGSAPKVTVHSRNTPLHLAFSCWVFDEQGRTLLTRRAATKRTWPGAWTNTFCGHPGPGESMTQAVHRRAQDELGTAVDDPVPALPDFRYRAVMDDGTVENEICPVYAARLLAPPRPNPEEVSSLRWTPFVDLAAAVSRLPSVYSPWLREQLDALRRVEWVPPASSR
jgi:isopentenyl-diphosphate Delta-isomerase